MAVVYVVQKQVMKNERGVFVPMFNLRPAEDFGRLEFLLGPQSRPWDSGVVPMLHEKLRWYSQDDYLLLIGNPCLIGLTTAVASEYSATINFLQWNGQEKRYLKVVVNIDEALP